MSDAETPESPVRLGAVVGGLIAVLIGVVAIVQLYQLAGDLREATDRLEECNTPAPRGEDPRGRCFEENQARDRTYIAHLTDAMAAYVICAQAHADIPSLKACAEPHIRALTEESP
jgi:hypothetical protein